jgi:hypothetical protein
MLKCNRRLTQMNADQSKPWCPFQVRVPDGVYQRFDFRECSMPTEGREHLRLQDQSGYTPTSANGMTGWKNLCRRSSAFIGG